MVFSFSVTTFEMSEATEVVTTGASASTSRGKRTATTDTGTAKLQRSLMLFAYYQINCYHYQTPLVFNTTKTTKRDAFLTNEQSRFAIVAHKTVSLDPHA